MEKKGLDSDLQAEVRHLVIFRHLVDKHTWIHSKFYSNYEAGPVKLTEAEPHLVIWAEFYPN